MLDNVYSREGYDFFVPKNYDLVRDIFGRVSRKILIFFSYLRENRYTMSIYIFDKKTMIGYIVGKIIEITDTQVLVLTSGWVGYELGINEVIFSQIATKEDVELYVHHHITEGNQSLFGFVSVEEKQLFMQLLKISGVGWKVALQILSMGKNTLIEAVQQDDKKTIESIKGIGKKMAEKIVLELKDKDFVKSHISSWNSKNSTPEQIKLPATLLENITGTLQNMGYQNRDIQRVLQTLPEEMQSVEDILPYMIKELS